VRIVIAVGGNALLRESQRGTWAEQLSSARDVARAVVALHEDGHEVVLTHGNGPQVGTLMLERDPAFNHPTKPVGPFYSEEEAFRLSRERGWRVGPDSGRGWRCLVASPRPVEILELEQIRALAERGAVVIAGGGGGIPVVRRDGVLAGVAAVIDKDRCSAELGNALGAELLVLLTAVPRVVQDFGTRWERPLHRLSVAQARALREAGEFPPGSMGPKIESAEAFVEGGGRAAIITEAACLQAAVRGEDGTWIERAREAVAA
jgi:carbamate kinase